MDILSLIRDKTTKFPRDDSFRGLEAVIIHIETAEKYLLRGKQEGDEGIFTDAIYRCNHAFEGILKEAYTILADKDATSKTPAEIEKYLNDNNVFRHRVMGLFRNYRTEWRNASTHDYKIFFTEEEAFLAIVSVLAFVSILLDQMIEKINYKSEKLRTEERQDVIKSALTGYEALPFPDQIRELLLAFTNELVPSLQERTSMTESELSGLLEGFISSIDPTIRMEREPLLSRDFSFRPDMILSRANQCAILELKRATPVSSNVQKAEHQLLTYLIMSRTDTGLLYFWPPEVAPMLVKDSQTDVSGRHLRIIEVFPKLATEKEKKESQSNGA